jgi:hypothetical protein
MRWQRKNQKLLRLGDDVETVGVYSIRLFDRQKSRVSMHTYSTSNHKAYNLYMYVLTAQYDISSLHYENYAL